MFPNDVPFWGWGVWGGLSFSFFWNLVLFEVASHSWNSSHRYSETSQPPSWKEAQLLSRSRPNKNRAGPRPLDARGQARPCRTRTLPFLREDNYTAVRASLPHLKERERIFLSVSSLRRLWGPWGGGAAVTRKATEKRFKYSEISTLLTWHGYDTLRFIFWRLNTEKNRAWHIVGVQ